MGRGGAVRWYGAKHKGYILYGHIKSILEMTEV